MKFLCLCQYGHSRSVAMCRALHARKHEAVPVGVSTSPSSVEVLGAWADVIVIMEGWFQRFVPPHLMAKVYCCEVGPDRWANPYNHELADIVKKFVPELEAIRA